MNKEGRCQKRGPNVRIGCVVGNLETCGTHGGLREDKDGSETNELEVNRDSAEMGFKLSQQGFQTMKRVMHAHGQGSNANRMYYKSRNSNTRLVIRSLSDTKSDWRKENMQRGLARREVKKLSV